MRARERSKRTRIRMHLSLRGGSCARAAEHARAPFVWARTRIRGRTCVRGCVRVRASERASLRACWRARVCARVRVPGCVLVRASAAHARVPASTRAYPRVPSLLAYARPRVACMMRVALVTCV
eukprot:6199398-Pleurochrysis_carterae.AAC.1